MRNSIKLCAAALFVALALGGQPARASALFCAPSGFSSVDPTFCSYTAIACYRNLTTGSDCADAEDECYAACSACSDANFWGCSPGGHSGTCDCWDEVPYPN